MYTALRAAFATALALVASGATTGAMAETHWQRAHPRRVEVNHRIAHENARIRHERREGEISHRQAVAMHAREVQVRAEERSMAARDHGHISAVQEHELNQQAGSIPGGTGR